MQYLDYFKTFLKLENSNTATIKQLNLSDYQDKIDNTEWEEVTKVNIKYFNHFINEICKITGKFIKYRDNGNLDVITYSSDNNDSEIDYNKFIFMVSDYYIFVAYYYFYGGHQSEYYFEVDGIKNLNNLIPSIVDITPFVLLTHKEYQHNITFKSLEFTDSEKETLEDHAKELYAEYDVPFDVIPPHPNGRNIETIRGTFSSEVYDVEYDDDEDIEGDGVPHEILDYKGLEIQYCKNNSGILGRIDMLRGLLDTRYASVEEPGDVDYQNIYYFKCLSKRGFEELIGIIVRYNKMSNI